MYSEDGKIIAEMFPNEDFVKMKGITNVEEVFAKKTEEINAELPHYKRIVKTIVRGSEFDKTASGKIKRKHNS